MAQLQRSEGQIELKCDANKFFDVWGHNTYLVPKLAPNKFSNVELHEGVGHKLGAIITWTYADSSIGDNASVKTRVEEFDENNRLVRYSYHGGFILENYYKTLKSMIQATPKDEGCIVTWSFEFEKMKEEAPDAIIYADFLLQTAKDIGDCLCNNNA